VPNHFGERTDSQGRVVEDQPGEVRRGPWPVELAARGAACQDDARFSWSLDGNAIDPEQTGRCLFRTSVPHEGRYEVGLVAEAGSEKFELNRTIDVQDLLIVSIGDSVASGEGVPDVADPENAVWQSRRCHRSARAGPALAAKAIETEDRHTSVTFVHLACSGATVPAGLTGPYNGVEPKSGEPPPAAQVDVLNRLEKIRPVDAVLLSVGANDVHFGEIVRFCALAPPGNCFAKPFNPVGPGEGSDRTAAEVVAEALADLPRRYGELDQRIDPSIPRSKIHIVEYFDPTGDSNGKTCEGGPPGVSQAELEQAHDGMLVPLNSAVAAAAEKHGWDEVRGVAAKFRTHGYCAPQPWVMRLTRSFLELGGSPPLKRLLGTLHPDREGQEAIGALIRDDLQSEFFPRRAFFHLSPGSGDTHWWEEPAFLVLVGAVLAAVLLISPLAAGIGSVVGAIARMLRPLLLPLFVVVAVGAVHFGAVAAILVSFAAIVVGWLLVVAPAARECDVALGWELRLAKRLFAYLLLLVGGAVAFWALSQALSSNVYTETVGLTAGLMYLAVGLWVAALAFRLASFAETRVRAAIAVLAGLALLWGLIWLGVVPGPAGLIAPRVPLVLAVAAAALLLLDIAVEAHVGGAGFAEKLRAEALSQSTAERIRALGFTVAMAAATALFAATTWGLVEAGNRGGALNPPPDVSVEAKEPPQAEGLGNRALNRRYAPVLAFTKDEPWTPISVDSYLENATLIGPEGPIGKGLTPAELPTACPGGRSDCFKLTIECDSGEEECAHGEVRQRDPEKIYEEGAVYVRGPLRKSKRPGLFPDRGPFREELQTLIQYWYFYYYDEWKAPVFAGVLTQKHESDWEVVTLGLDENDQPLFVADSAHCGGSWRQWNEIEVSTKLPGPHVHPLVAVAEGSHANYPDPKQKRTSDPAHCAGLPEGVAAAVSYASNIRDKTEYGWAWYPPEDGFIELKNDRGPPMSFPGTWGATDRTTLTNFKEHDIGNPKAGPKTPSLQGPWTNPVGTIFCGRYKPPVRADPESFDC
jgi:hypothetical protein